MQTAQLNKEIIFTVNQFAQLNLGVGTAGNASARFEDTFLISPSAMPYDSLGTADIVEMDMSGNVKKGNKKPSSEWRFHRDIYLNRPEINAIVHVHSPHATALSCNHLAIPPFHYMVAIAGGSTIPCAEYATFGTQELSNNIIQAMGTTHACLMANHGLITVGHDLNAALSLAVEIENLAKQYILCQQAGEPELLSEREMQLNLEKFKSYGNL
jgi:L-fuculose-phosphate aldolase